VCEFSANEVELDLSRQYKLGNCKKNPGS